MCQSESGYHGMTAEQFLWAWLRSELIEPRELHCEPRSLYYELMKNKIENPEKEEKHEPNRRKRTQKRS